MPAAAALILTLSLVAGIFLGFRVLPDTASATAQWWQTSRARATVALSGTVTSVEDGAFVIDQQDAPSLRVAYDKETVTLARPERVVDGHVDGVRLLVVPAGELLRPGALVRVVVHITERSGAPYAFAVIAIPL